MRVPVWTAAAGILLATVAQAQDTAKDYPDRAVKIIVNVAPGGGVDTTTRLIAQKLHGKFGHPFVVENRPGAGGNIGAEAVYVSPPDGYTLMASSPSPLSINGWLYKKLPFDPAGFEVAAMMSRIPNVLVVRKDFPAKTIQEFIAYVKSHPGKLTFASQGVGTASHLTGELFMSLTGAKLTHVPYKGTGPALNDLVAGHIDLSFIQFSSAYQLHQTGKARVLAAATDKRLESMPDIPTMAEAGLPEVQSETWNAISAPPKTPMPILAKLNQAINAALTEQDVKKRFRELHLLAGGGSLAETKAFVERERALWGKVIKAAGVPQH